MEDIYYQHNCQQESIFTKYIYHPEKNNIQKITLHTSLKNILASVAENMRKEDNKKNTTTFLLQDTNFSFFQFDIYLDTDEPFSQQKLDEIIQEKKKYIKINKNISAQFRSSYIDNSYSNGEKKAEIFWEQGKILFRLYMIYIDDICINTFRAFLGNNLSKIMIIPQSLYSILFIKHKLQRECFIMLYIDNYTVRCITIEQGFYKNEDTINLGSSMVKKMYDEHNISQFWNTPIMTIKNNPLAQELIEQSLTFYTQMLSKRLIEKGIVQSDIFLISSLLKNQYFIENFNTQYKKAIKTYTKIVRSNYIIPFQHSSLLETFGRTWSPEKIDILTYLNKDTLFYTTDNHFSETPHKGFTTKNIAPLPK